MELSAEFSWSLTFSNHGFALFYRDLIVPNFLSINGTRCGVALLMLNFNHLSDLIDVNGSFKPKCFRFTKDIFILKIYFKLVKPLFRR